MSTEESELMIYKQCFQMADVNGNGTISLNRVLEVLEEMSDLTTVNKS